MKTSSNHLDNMKVEITVTIPAGVIDEKFQSNLDNAVQNIDVPGFRKGKAPRNVIERHVDIDKLWNITRQDIISDTLRDALKSENINFLTYDDIKQDTHTPGEDFIYHVTVSLMPEIPQFEYRDIPVKVTKYVVTDEHVDSSIENLRISWAESKPVTDRPAKLNDWALIYIEGYEFSRIKIPGKSDAQKNMFPPSQLTLQIGGDRSIPWLEHEITGMNVKESKTCYVTMPKNFINPPLEKDTEIEAKITLLWLEEKDMPELTEDYLVEHKIAKDTIELKKKVKSEIEKQFKHMEDHEAVDAIHDWLIENVKFNVPEDIVGAKKEEITERLRQEYHRRGEDLDNLLKRIDEDATRIRSEIDKQAEELARMDFIISHIADKEELEVTQPEILNQIQMIAQSTQLKKHQLKKLTENEAFIIQVYNQILSRKVTNFLLNHCKKEYVEEKTQIDTPTLEDSGSSIIIP
jgi:trigger factor